MNGTGIETVQLNWKSLSFLVGLIVLGVVSAVGITTYLDKRAASIYFERTEGMLLTSRVAHNEKAIEAINQKMMAVETQQTQILVELGRMDAKLNVLLTKLEEQ